MSFPITFEIKMSRSGLGLHKLGCYSISRSCSFCGLMIAGRHKLLVSGRAIKRFRKRIFISSKGNESILHYENWSALQRFGRKKCLEFDRQLFLRQTQRVEHKVFKRWFAGGGQLPERPSAWEMIFYSADGTIRSVMNYNEGRLVVDLKRGRRGR